MVPKLAEPDDTSTILLVAGDDLNRQLLRAMLKATPYRIQESRRPQEAIQLLETMRVDLVIVNMVMPEMDGAEFCRRAKANRQTQFIPILMLASVQGIENADRRVGFGRRRVPLHAATAHVSAIAHPRHVAQ